MYVLVRAILGAAADGSMRAQLALRKTSAHLKGVRMAKPMHEKLKKLRASCGMQQLLANNAGNSAAEENNAFPPSLPRLSRLPLVDGTGLFKGAGAGCISLIACTLRSRHSFELGAGASDSKPR